MTEEEIVERKMIVWDWLKEPIEHNVNEWDGILFVWAALYKEVFAIKHLRIVFQFSEYHVCFNEAVNTNNKQQAFKTLSDAIKWYNENNLRLCHHRTGR